MELNSKKAQKAWQDYKGFIEGLGVKIHLNPGVEQAFKLGYAKGAAENAAPIHMPPMDATPTEKVIEAVNGAGGDWYEKSASGHIAKVMERYPVIKKIGFGLYEYQG